MALPASISLPYPFPHPSKRRRQDALDDIIASLNAQNEEDLEQQNDLWADHNLFALDVAPLFEDAQLPSHAPDVQQTQAKRPYEDDMLLSLQDFPELDAFLDAPETFAGDHQLPQQTLSHVLPELYPSLPQLEHRDATASMTSPFNEDSTEHYSFENRLYFEIPEGGEINGYIKFRIRPSEKSGDVDEPKKHGLFDQAGMAVHHRHVPGVPNDKPPHLPPDFGRAMKLDPTDNKLWRFYLNVFCIGRTLLSKTNFWVTDLAAIADGNECVKYALLASTAAYVLDYQSKNQKLRVRANAYYRRAADLLDRSLRNRTLQEIGKEEAIVTAILFLVCDDIVNWETRKPGDCNPKWRQGTRIAKAVLDSTDPGYRYWHLANVQSSSARLALANRVAFVDILTLPVSHLVAARGDRMYGWLMEGEERELQKIFGGTGLCPKLLHTFAQITHLCALMADTTDSRIYPLGAKTIADRLAKLCQWSELSEGYETPEELFDSCTLDANGHVQTIVKVTELTAEAWRAAAQIYLQCRFFRLPRTHPEVLKFLSVLCRCIERMPSSGPLFSSQAPFFTIFLIGLVAVHDEHRRVARQWFNVVVDGASCRSSVPPIWQVIQDMWAWMDAELVDQLFDDELPIGERDAWWEKVVDRLLQTAGLLSLC
ncbi:hypothetical protein AJ80_05430 [Polytolypa hystricis UAMH7299]|uniref:Transcription factor domain-containing protein n=1 Tax=Polytolypa hystricis (strain UAMH7299) TaxID=1447883 RepID=A0A2B7Y4F9_POLH7|nr:hypothetical protein AJ80_05430 [Polytolypa hystricis UAMH7299]